jgi:hypothetical protein
VPRSDLDGEAPDSSAPKGRCLGPVKGVGMARQSTRRGACDRGQPREESSRFTVACGHGVVTVTAETCPPRNALRGFRPPSSNRTRSLCSFPQSTATARLWGESATPGCAFTPATAAVCSNSARNPRAVVAVGPAFGTRPAPRNPQLRSAGGMHVVAALGTVLSPLAQSPMAAASWVAGDAVSVFKSLEVGNRARDPRASRAVGGSAAWWSVETRGASCVRRPQC